MNLRKAILALALFLISILCFFPPQREVDGFKDGRNQTLKVADYYKLARWVVGLAALSGASIFLVGPSQPVVLPAKLK